MQWSDESGAGFTELGVEPWLPLGDHHLTNVAAQRSDENSILSLTRALISLRRAEEDLRSGAQVTIPSPEGTYVYERGAGMVVALNMSDVAATIDLDGEVLNASFPRTTDTGPLRLEPWAGVVIRRND